MNMKPRESKSGTNSGSAKDADPGTPGKRSRKQQEMIVSNIPLTLSSVFHLFMKNGRRISVTVLIK